MTLSIKGPGKYDIKPLFADVPKYLISDEKQKKVHLWILNFIYTNTTILHLYCKYSLIFEKNVYKLTCYLLHFTFYIWEKIKKNKLKIPKLYNNK